MSRVNSFNLRLRNIETAFPLSDNDGWMITDAGGGTVYITDVAMAYELRVVPAFGQRGTKSEEHLELQMVAVDDYEVGPLSR